jgi:nucleoid-associated protein YgaU
MRSVIHGLPGSTWLFGLLMLLLGTPAYSQSLGDIARQERERKRDQPNQVTHVYDNDDLARPHILLPEDEKRIQAEKKKRTPTANEAPVETVDTEPTINVPVPIQIPRVPHPLKTALPEPNLHSRVQQLRPDDTTLAHPTNSRPAARLSITPSPSRVVQTQREDVDSGMHHDEISGDTQIRIQPGDTLWKLAGKYLGDGKDWRVLASCNPQVTDPMRLRVGMSVRLPEEAAHFQPPKRVLVERGDSLWKLAQVHLGDGNAWNCVAQANPDLENYNLILVGQVLAIPESCASPPSARTRRLAVSTKPLPGSTAQLLRQGRRLPWQTPLNSSSSVLSRRQSDGSSNRFS